MRTWLPSSLFVVILPLMGFAFSASPANAQTEARARDTAVSQPQDVASRVAAARTRKSWNPHVSCRATLTTLRVLLGRHRNEYGGATYRGGGFKPGIPDKRAFHPPCAVHRHTTFVQLNRVVVGACNTINDDGDWACNLTDPSTPARRSIHMKSIHIETDKAFRRHSGWSKPPGGQLINVQGFVYWDPRHTTAAWHHFSGWELHSFTAWRASASNRATLSAQFAMRSCGLVS